MKMIDVFDLMAKGEIEEGTKLKIYDNSSIYIYEYRKIYKMFLGDEYRRLDQDFIFDEVFLNLEVELSEPEEKMYQLKLYAEDDLSYVTRSSYDYDFNYDISSKSEFGEFITKFTQDEIDEDKFLKFIEQHGIKEEVKE